MPKLYTTIARVEAYMLTDIAPDFEDNVTRWIEGVSQHIDTVTGRTFIGDDEASDRVFIGSGTTTLFIDDAIDVESVTIGGVALNMADYVVVPATATPVTKLISAVGVWPVQAITISAKWGYGSVVPADIEYVATVMVAGIINANMPGGDSSVVSESIGKYSVSYGSVDAERQKDFEIAKDILQTYKRILF